MKQTHTHTYVWRYWSEYVRETHTGFLRWSEEWFPNRISAPFILLSQQSRLLVMVTLFTLYVFIRSRVHHGLLCVTVWVQVELNPSRAFGADQLAYVDDWSAVPDAAMFTGIRSRENLNYNYSPAGLFKFIGFHHVSENVSVHHKLTNKRCNHV